MSQLVSINPSNNQILGKVNPSSIEDIQAKVNLAHESQNHWRDMGVAERVKLLKNAFEEFKQRQHEISLLEATEMGTPITEAEGNFKGSMNYAEWNFANAEKYLSPEVTLETSKQIHTVYREPHGVAAVIIPWNFPFGNFVWNCLQKLIAGNTVVLKHSEECPLSGKLIEEVLTKHLPKGVFNEIYGDGEVGSALLEQNIHFLTFTGSSDVGKLLYQKAGAKFIKAVMELGGSAPGIIFADADPDDAVNEICGLRLYNAGQCCDGLKRLLVHESLVEKTTSKISAIFSAKKVGNAIDKQTEIGPLVSKKQLDLLISQVDDAIAKGAKVITGGKSLEKELGGNFYMPTVLTNVTPDMQVWNQEVFGPVLPIISFKTEEEAIQLANQTRYGLGAYIFTANKDKSLQVARSIESGMISINGASYIHPHNPFGGYKNSGIGMINGKYGFHEVTHPKVIAKLL